MRTLAIVILAIVLAVLAGALFVQLVSPRAPHVQRLSEVHVVRDTVVIVRRVPARVVRYQTVPRIDTVVREGLPTIVLSHDTLSPSGDSVSIQASYPPPSLLVYFRTASLNDTTRLVGSLVRQVLRDTVLVPQRHVLNPWLTAGVGFVAGLVTMRLLR